MVNPPAPLPIVLANRLEGKSYGAELTADYRLTNTWQLRAGYTELRVRTEAKPGRTDTTRARGDPDRQLSRRSSLDVPAMNGATTVDRDRCSPAWCRCCLAWLPCGPASRCSRLEAATGWSAGSRPPAPPRTIFPSARWRGRVETARVG